ncbi:MAG: hypothetical protein U0T81_09025 [Saprospiraceae bacterium]
MAKTKRKLMEATSVIEDSETRTRVIERKLKHVQILPQDKAISLLDSDVLNDKNESNEKMTICNAVIELLNRAGKPQTPHEILDLINKHELYQFNTKTPLNGKESRIESIPKELN